MKPHRIRMTHNLLLNYGLYRKMEIYVSFCFFGVWVVNWGWGFLASAQGDSRGDDKVP